MNILLVEDDPSILRGLEMNLSIEGYEIETADDGDEGLTRALAEPWDLLILDIMLPKLDGLSLIGRLRRQKVMTPVIILSAQGTIPEAVDATKKGAFSFLAEPLDSKTLERQIGEALAAPLPSPA